MIWSRRRENDDGDDDAEFFCVGGREREPDSQTVGNGDEGGGMGWE